MRLPMTVLTCWRADWVETNEREAWGEPCTLTAGTAMEQRRAA